MLWFVVETKLCHSFQSAFFSVLSDFFFFRSAVLSRFDLGCVLICLRLLCGIVCVSFLHVYFLYSTPSVVIYKAATCCTSKKEQ